MTVQHHDIPVRKCAYISCDGECSNSAAELNPHVVLFAVTFLAVFFFLGDAADTDQTWVKEPNDHLYHVYLPQPNGTYVQSGAQTLDPLRPCEIQP
jgi:hypothetical protein